MCDGTALRVSWNQPNFTQVTKELYSPMVEVLNELFSLHKSIINYDIVLLNHLCIHRG